MKYNRYELPVLELSSGLLTNACIGGIVEQADELEIRNLMLTLDNPAGLSDLTGTLEKYDFGDIHLSVKTDFPGLSGFSDGRFDSFMRITLNGTGMGYKKALNMIKKHQYLMVDIDVNSIDIDAVKALLSEIDGSKSEAYYIMNPFFSEKLDFAKYDEITMLVDESKLSYLDRSSLSKYIIMEHPCNAFACYGNTCHQNKSPNPRDIYIDQNGNVFIYSSNKMIGNIFNAKLTAIFEHNRTAFENTARTIYRMIIDYPFTYFPWREVYIKETGSGRYGN